MEDGHANPKQVASKAAPKKRKAEPAAKSEPSKKQAKKKKSACSFSARGVCDSASGGKFWQVEVSDNSLTTTCGPYNSFMWAWLG